MRPSLCFQLPVLTSIFNRPPSTVQSILCFLPIWLTLKPGFLPLFFGTLSGGRDSGYRLGKSILATLRRGGLPLFLPGIFPGWLGMKEGATAADCMSPLLLLLLSDFCAAAASTLIWSCRQKWRRRRRRRGDKKKEPFRPALCLHIDPGYYKSQH